jgi:ectoine hydroxylase-related dioxygenase (phytanoyl-CoA dioxygenase family)
MARTPDNTYNLVSEEDIRTYHEDGAVCLRGVLSQKWLDTLADGFDQAVAAPGRFAKNYGPEGAPRYHTDHELFSRFDPFHKFLFEGPTVQVAAEIMGTARIDLYDEHLLIKEAGAPAPTYWHHDMPYFSIAGDQLASIWFALDPTREDTGALRFAKGSHKWGKLYQPIKIGENVPVESFNRDDLVATVPDIDNNPDEYPTVLMETDPGDIIVFHGLTLHSSSGNSNTENSRRALSLRYAGDDIRWKNRSDAPLIFDRTLNDGDPLSLVGDQCPQVWPRA